MGRTAAPAALRLLHGDGEGRDSGGRMVPVGPAFKRLRRHRPTTWSARRDEWDRVVPGLTRLDLLKPEDCAVLVTFIPPRHQQVGAAAPIPVRVRLVWAVDGEEWQEGRAVGWCVRRGYLPVVLVQLHREPRSRFTSVWVAADDVERR